MTSTDLIPAALLKRKAVVYVRQSTQSQVMTNLESQRRQYDLVDIARQRGFADIEVIDDDLGRSASGTVARPGFDRLVACLCGQDRRRIVPGRIEARTGGTGFICSSCVDLSKPASSTTMASTTPACLMIVCSWA